MKKTFRFIGTIIVAALVGFAAMCIAIAFDASDKVAIASYFGVAIVIAAVLGAFREERSASRFDTIRHYDGRKNYGQAAVFIGTACLFIGEPNECWELADDMWHYAQQAEVRALDGDIEFDIL